jgi:N-formylmaleamate deformylase
MLQYKDGEFTAKGIKLHYYRTGGNKPPIILLHGATDNGLCWTPIAEELSQKHDVIMLDAQGHGLSDKLDANFTFNSHTEQVAELVKQLGLNKPIIMGHSMGAGTTTNVAVAYPDLPKAIVLEDPAWLQQDTMPPPNQADIKAYMASLSKMTLEELMAEGRTANPTWPEAEIHPWAESKMQYDKRLFDFMAVNPGSYKVQVPKIKCPTLLIIAENGLVAKDTAEKASGLWKSPQPFKWVLIKKAGHSIRRENYADYKKALFDFLDSLPY